MGNHIDTFESFLDYLNCHFHMDDIDYDIQDFLDMCKNSKNKHETSTQEELALERWALVATEKDIQELKERTIAHFKKIKQDAGEDGIEIKNGVVAYCREIIL